jgi:hypothetical protein
LRITFQETNSLKQLAGQKKIKICIQQLQQSYHISDLFQLEKNHNEASRIENDQTKHNTNVTRILLRIESK